MYFCVDMLCIFVYNIDIETGKEMRQMTPRSKTIKMLERNGWYLDRHGKKHDIYCNDELKKSIPVKRHDFNENDAKYILKEAGLK